jgi:hypothetical protein
MNHARALIKIASRAINHENLSFASFLISAFYDKKLDLTVVRSIGNLRL